MQTNIHIRSHTLDLAARCTFKSHRAHQRHPHIYTATYAGNGHSERRSAAEAHHRPGKAYHPSSAQGSCRSATGRHHTGLCRCSTRTSPRSPGAAALAWSAETRCRLCAIGMVVVCYYVWRAPLIGRPRNSTDGACEPVPARRQEPRPAVIHSCTAHGRGAAVCVGRAQNRLRRGMDAGKHQVGYFVLNVGYN